MGYCRAADEYCGDTAVERSGIAVSQGRLGRRGLPGRTIPGRTIPGRTIGKWTIERWGHDDRRRTV